MIPIVFIVNGEDVEVECPSPRTPLYLARTIALEDSGNTGRPSGEWDIRTEAGDEISATLRLMDADIRRGARMFLSLGVGCGGVS